MNKRLLLISILLIIGGCIGLYLLLFSHINYEKMNDSEFLTSIGIWQNDIATRTKYEFKSDGSGSYTLDGKTFTSYKWSFLKNKLLLEFSNDYNELYEYRCDKKNVKLTFIKGNSELDFYKDGSIEDVKAPKTKDKELFGIWNAGDIYLVLDKELSGYGYMDDKNLYITNEIEWGTYKNNLNIISSSGINKNYVYKKFKNNFKIYVDEEEARNYVKVEGKYNIKKK